MNRSSGPARAAARELRLAEEALRDHKKICLACHRAAKACAGACAGGMKLASYAELMRRQVELLKPPPGLEMVQDTLF